MTREKRKENLENITFIVKTFERFYCIKRLVKSIYRYYPNAKILIADDSEKSCKAYLERKYARKELKVYELPKDVGLSYGRNYLLDRVETEYFCLLDDDFVFDEKTDINTALEMMRERTEVDILGGYFRNYIATMGIKPYLRRILRRIKRKKEPFRPYNYIGELKLDSDNQVLYCNYITKQFPDYEIVDIVHNFFVARTCVIRDRNRWDEELKLQEHTAFFVMAKLKGIRVAFTNRFSVQHWPYRPEKYTSFRSRNYFEIFLKKMNIRKVVSTYDGGEVKIREI